MIAEDIFLFHTLIGFRTAKVLECMCLTMLNLAHFYRYRLNFQITTHRYDVLWGCIFESEKTYVCFKKFLG